MTKEFSAQRLDVKAFAQAGGRLVGHESLLKYERLAQEGRLPATFEVVYGHAWKAEAKKTADGAAIVRFDPKQRP